jgi:hypothetical protein
LTIRGCRLQKARGLGAISTRHLERVLDQILLERSERRGRASALKTHRWCPPSAASAAGVGVEHFTVAHQHRAFHDVLQLANVARPVIRHEHVDRGRRDAADPLAMIEASRSRK